MVVRWFITENPIKMDNLGVVFPLLFFGNNKHFQDWVFAGVQKLLEFSEKSVLALVYT